MWPPPSPRLASPKGWSPPPPKGHQPEEEGRRGGQKGEENQIIL